MGWSQDQYRLMARHKAILLEWTQLDGDISSLCLQYNTLKEEIDLVLEGCDYRILDAADLTFFHISAQEQIIAISNQAVGCSNSLKSLDKKLKFLVAEVRRSGTVDLLKDSYHKWMLFAEEQASISMLTTPEHGLCSWSRLIASVFSAGRMLSSW